MVGLICVFHNPMFPEHLTIRKTTGSSARECIREIQQESSSVPTSELIVVYEKPVSNCDVAEKAIYNRLSSKRQKYKKDKFLLAPEHAVDIIEKTIQSLIQGELLNKSISSKKVEESSNRDWWNSLSYSWKNVLKSSIKLRYEPTDEDILRGIHNAIDNSGNSNLRKRIGHLIIDKNYARNLGAWYSGLRMERSDFEWYLPYELSDDELADIVTTDTVNCHNSSSIIDLKPIERLSRLKNLNISNTDVSDLTPLAGLNNLVELAMSFTNVKSLQPLSKVKTMKKLICTDIQVNGSNAALYEEISAIEKDLPNCEVISQSFLNSPVPRKIKRLRKK